MDWNNFYVSSLGNLNSNSNPLSVVNLFKLSNDYTSSHDQNTSSKPDDLLDLKTNLFRKSSETCSLVNFQKDLQLWDRDKSAVIDIVTKRLRNLDDSKQKTEKTHTPDTNQEQFVTARATDEPEIVMPNESEILVSWLDKYFSDNERITDEAYKIFVENAAKLFSNTGLNPINFISFLVDIGKLSTNKSPNFLTRYLRVSLNHLHRHSWGSLHISILNTKGVFMNSLVFKENMSTEEVLKTLIECANLVYPPQANPVDTDLLNRTQEYYFYLAYLLFRSGSPNALNSLVRDKEANLETYNLDHTQFPILFNELCIMLRDILLEKPNENRHYLLDQFSTEYLSFDDAEDSFVTKSSSYYSQLLLSIVYPDYYSECNPSKLGTKEDYLWYKIHRVLGFSGADQVQAACRLCHSLTHQANDINYNDADLYDKIFSYAYSIALAGGIMESLRLLMSALKLSSVQAFVVFFVVYYENCHLFDFEELKYIAHTLWNLNDRVTNQSDDLSYLLQLAFNRNRKVSSELKILLSTILPPPKCMIAVKYAVAENFNDAIQPCFLGSSITKNGMLLVGPLLQKLIKLSSKRTAAKYAILLLAQYSAHVGLPACAFKCFYCIQDIENCSSVLEACCCYLYDNNESDVNKTFNIEDLSVYYTLLKNLAPNNKHVLELKNVFNCIQLSVLVKTGEYLEAVNFCKKNKVFDNSLHILRNESHQIYFNALYNYTNALKCLVSVGKQPSELLNSAEANYLLDLLESAYQNTNTDRSLTIDALHLLLTFISIVPPK